MFCHDFLNSQWCFQGSHVTSMSQMCLAHTHTCRDIWKSALCISGIQWRDFKILQQLFLNSLKLLNSFFWQSCERTITVMQTAGNESKYKLLKVLLWNHPSDTMNAFFFHKWKQEKKLLTSRLEVSTQKTFHSFQLQVYSGFLKLVWDRDRIEAMAGDTFGLNVGHTESHEMQIFHVRLLSGISLNVCVTAPKKTISMFTALDSRLSEDVFKVIELIFKQTGYARKRTTVREGKCVHQYKKRCCTPRKMPPDNGK